MPETSNFVSMLKLQKTEQHTVGGKATPARVYRDDVTGSEITTYLLYTDKRGQRWWTFEDLFTMPMMRQMAAKKVVDLYGHDLALADILAHTGQMKVLLKSNDAERYEKVYAKVLELEQLSSSMADVTKQCIGLSTVYLLLDDEDPATYNQQVQNQKFTILSLDLEAQGFFLTWWTEHMKRSGQLFKGLSRIASTLSQ